MNHLALITLAGLGLSLAACGDPTDKVQQAPAPDAPLESVPLARANVAAAQVAAPLGMTAKDLEDADIRSVDGAKLGEVDALIMDPNNAVTHLIVELEGPGDVKVVLPLDGLTPVTKGDDKDLQTTLTAAQLNALPPYDPRTPLPG